MRRRYFILAHSCLKSANMTSYVVFMAALRMAVGQDNVYHRCRDSPISYDSRFIISCDAGKIIIVKSAIIGATDIFMPPEQQCPVTNNTCLKEITIVAELCTGRNSCDISQNILLFNESKLSCPRNGSTVGNFITINYTCIVPDEFSYGDICHFDGLLYLHGAVYISSYPNFPDSMGSEVNYQCSCLLTSMSSSSSVNVIIRALLVKLTGRPILGISAACSERLSVISSGNETKLEFCSPCNDVNNVTTVPLASGPIILFRRDANVNPFNGKFILEITVSSESSGSGSLGSIKCGLVGSTMSSSTTFTSTSPSYPSTTTPSAILSQPSAGSSSIRIHNTTSTVAAFIQPAYAISAGAIFGIVLGVLGFLAVLSLAALFTIKNLRSKRNGAQSTELMPSATDPRLDRSSVDKNPDYETTIEGNGLQVNQPKISSQVPNMKENQDPPEHSYYNETISNITPLPDNHDHYEPLTVTNNQQQNYYNQPSENSNYQPLNFS